MMGEFEAIRPYSDAEVPAVLQRLLSDDAFLGALVRYRFPRLAGPLGWLLKPLIAHRLAREVTGIRSVATLQDKFEPYVDHTIEKATDGVTYSGVNRLKPGCAYLFIANHRDIVMDPAFVNYAVYHAGLPTPRIAIGDNLLQKSFVSDLMRLNKSFIVHRSLSGRREKLAAYQTLSAYINHSIREDRQSVWIAQAEGRAKDGDDRTDSAILKMFHMSRKDEPFAEMVRALHFIPVSISYEYDPCDLAKARELHTRASTGEYRKAPGEDDASIALGITGYKGRVHINFGAELEGEFSDAKQLAAELDRQILGNYRLFPVHYLAYEMSENRDPGLAVPTAESLFGSEELEKARKEWNRRLEQCPAEQRPGWCCNTPTRCSTNTGSSSNPEDESPAPPGFSIGQRLRTRRRWTDNRDTLIRVRFGSPRQGSQSRVLAQLTSSARPRQAVPNR